MKSNSRGRGREINEEIDEGYQKISKRVKTERKSIMEMEV
jgi:hypothetical protein